jgi:hypothetical protein
MKEKIIQITSWQDIEDDDYGIYAITNKGNLYCFSENAYGDGWLKMELPKSLQE